MANITKNKCIIPGCAGKMHGNIYCTKHYGRNLKYGDPLHGEKTIHEICTAEGCEKKPRSKYAEYCETHYYQIRRNGKLGSPLDDKKVDNCVYCGEKLTVNQVMFCSMRCTTRHYRGNPLTRVCIICKNEYTPDNNGIDRITCSDKCREQHRHLIYVNYKESKAIFETFAERIAYAEHIEKDPDGYLVCKCAYCGKKFHPTPGAVRCRADALEGKTQGELRLYCSNKCKQACPTYRVKLYYRGHKIGHAREVPVAFRHMALADRNYTCERCGSKQNGLHVHHIEGYAEQPMVSSDLNNVLVVCKRCHKLIHSQPGCTYFDYQREACEPDIKEAVNQQFLAI